MIQDLPRKSVKDEELQALQAELTKREELLSLQEELERREKNADNHQHDNNNDTNTNASSSHSHIENPLKRVGGIFTHGLATSAGGLADLANMATKDMEGGFALDNDLTEQNSPSYSLKEYKPESVSQMVGDKVNQLFGTNLEPKDALEKFVHLMGEFSLPLGPMGGSGGKAASALGKVGNKVGQKVGQVAQHEAIAAGGAAGITLAEEAGVENEVGKLASGMAGSALGTPNTLKAAMKTLGLTGKTFSPKAVEAAERLGVDIPLVAASDAKAVAIAHNLVGNTPLFGDAVTQKVKQAGEDYAKAFETLLDKVGPKTEDLQKAGRDIYAKLENIPLKDTDIVDV